MAAGAAWVGIPATVAPRSFYDDFPFVASWVEKLPPYNEHLVTDVGGLYLALAVIAAWAAWTMSLQLVRAVSAGWLVAAAIHFAFHASHLDDYGTFDAVAQMISLGAYVLLPLAALWGTTASAGTRTAEDEAT